jgi:exodeoxyribonuclease VII small subunit
VVDTELVIAYDPEYIAFGRCPSDTLWWQSLKSAFLHSGVLRFMATASKHGSAAPASYEAALQELEQLVGRLESGDMPLEQLLAQYQRGAELLKFCRDRLETVENQVKVLDQGALKTWTPE